MAIRQTRGEKAFDFLNLLIMLFLTLLMLYPVLLVAGRSFMGEYERAWNPYRIIPREWDLSGYRFILSSGSYVLRSYVITILRTVIGSFLNVVLTSMFAYAVSKKWYPPRTALTWIVIFTMWFSGGLIPTYLIIRALGLLNNFWVLILPQLIIPWNMFLLRNFFMSIPESLEESAKLDGANEIGILFKLVLPISKPALATITLFYAVSHWNAWFDAVVFINKRNLWPVQVFLRQIVSTASSIELIEEGVLIDLPPSETVKMAVIVVVMVPILCVYPFLQRYFVKGIIVGSLKG